MEFLTALIIIILVDGLKILVDSILYFKSKKIEHKKSSLEDVSICIPSYNQEKNINNLVQSLLDIGFDKRNIFIVDDGSSDDTYQVLKDARFGINLYGEENRGKVGALNWICEKVTTKYIMISDSDNVFDKDFSVDLSIFDDPKVTACAFDVIPVSEKKNHLLVWMQKHEYKKSMFFSRKGKGPHGSISCISGAVGLFKTERFKTLYKKHSTAFSGEDLQRTLIEQIEGGSVVWSDSKVYTECPSTSKSLFRQRLIGWSPGIFHCFPLFLKILFGKGNAKSLRYDMLYEILTTIFDPVKVVSFIYLAITGGWKTLVFIYLSYLFIELYVIMTIKSELRWTILFYPIYNFGNIIIKTISFFVYLKQRFFTKTMKALKYSIFTIILFMSLSGNSQDNVTVNANFQRVTDIRNENIIRKLNNVNLYADWKSWFASSDLMVNRNITLGKYYGDSYSMIRYRKNDVGVRVMQKLPIKVYPHGFYFNYQQIYEFFSQRHIFIPGITYERYWSDLLKSQVSFFQEIGRLNDFSSLVRLTYDKKLTLGFGINTYRYKSIFVNYKIKGFNFLVSYDQNFDYTNFHRLVVGIGYFRKF